MIREIIVTSPQGVRLAFEAKGEGSLSVAPCDISPGSLAIVDSTKPHALGIVPNTWLLELNENVT